MTSAAILTYGALFFCIVLVGAVAAVRRGLRGVGRARAYALAEEYPEKESKLLYWASSSNRVLLTLSIISTTAMVGAGYLAAWASLHTATGSKVILDPAETWLHILIGLVVVVASWIVGIVVPRALALRNPEKVALSTIGVVLAIHRVIAPLSFALISLGRAIAHPGSASGRRGKRSAVDSDALFGPEVGPHGHTGNGHGGHNGHSHSSGHNGSPDAARESAAEGDDARASDDDPETDQEQELVSSIFEFGDTIVREVMVPRPDMKCIPINATLEEALEVMVGGGFSRVPMYGENYDDIKGVLYAKDVLTQVGLGHRDSPLRNIVRPAHFIPETKKIDELLRELQKSRIHLALVVDEYGGTAGLVTMEDLLEEIFGEILDEYDLEEEMVETVDDDTLRLDARYPYDDLEELLGAQMPVEEGVDTTGGLVFSFIGHVPEPGERVVISGLTFEVEKMLGRRIRKVLVKGVSTRAASAGSAAAPAETDAMPKVTSSAPADPGVSVEGNGTASE